MAGGAACSASSSPRPPSHISHQVSGPSTWSQLTKGRGGLLPSSCRQAGRHPLRPIIGGGRLEGGRRPWGGGGREEEEEKQE